MYRFGSSIEIKSIKASIADYPLGNFKHILVVNNEINCSPEALADGIPRTTQLIGGVLVQAWVDSPMDFFRQS